MFNNKFCRSNKSLSAGHTLCDLVWTLHNNPVVLLPLWNEINCSFQELSLLSLSPSFPPSLSISSFCSHPNKHNKNVGPSEYCLCFVELLLQILNPFGFLCGDSLASKFLYAFKSGQIILQKIFANVLSQFTYQM